MKHAVYACLAFWLLVLSLSCQNKESIRGFSTSLAPVQETVPVRPGDLASPDTVHKGHTFQLSWTMRNLGEDGITPLPFNRITYGIGWKDTSANSSWTTIIDDFLPSDSTVVIYPLPGILPRDIDLTVWAINTVVLGDSVKKFYSIGAQKTRLYVEDTLRIELRSYQTQMELR